ncbi:hypothetical protein FS749_013996 [Ceratobasidium sp. UAMH 11750]|nr:hypothetical protein FS749_013996 [Ceratobasidium sp. UAMH 11750]
MPLIVHSRILRIQPPLKSIWTSTYHRTNHTSILAKLRMTSTPKPTSRVLVLGAGNFGSCLADHLADSTHQVYLWARSRQLIDTFNKERRNEKYLTDHMFPEGIEAIGPDLPSAGFLGEVDVVLFAVPTQALRRVLQELHPRMPETKFRS